MCFPARRRSCSTAANAALSSTTVPWSWLRDSQRAVKLAVRFKKKKKKKALTRSASFTGGAVLHSHCGANKSNPHSTTSCPRLSLACLLKVRSSLHPSAWLHLCQDSTVIASHCELISLFKKYLTSHAPTCIAAFSAISPPANMPPVSIWSSFLSTCSSSNFFPAELFWSVLILREGLLGSIIKAPSARASADITAALIIICFG